eukprot:5231399-Prymnesium_polylepis.2
MAPRRWRLLQAGRQAVRPAAAEPRIAEPQVADREKPQPAERNCSHDRSKECSASPSARTRAGPARSPVGRARASSHGGGSGSRLCSQPTIHMGCACVHVAPRPGCRAHLSN